MVDEDLKKMFEKRGVYVIPVETGTGLFTECVLNPPDEPLLIVGSTMVLPTINRGSSGGFKTHSVKRPVPVSTGMT